MKISKLILVLLIAMIIDVPYFSQTVNNLFTLIEGGLILIWTLPKMTLKKFHSFWYVWLFVFLIIFCTFVSFGVSTRTMTAIVLAIRVSAFYLGTQYIVRIKSGDYLVDTLFVFLSAIILVVDFIIVFTMGKGIGTSSDGVLPFYLIGNKFSVSYLHFLYIAIFSIQTKILKCKKKKNIAFAMLCFFTCIICLIMDCNTGLIGCLVIMLLSLFYNVKCINRLITSGWTFGFAFVILTFLLVGTNFLLENAVIKKIIVDIFHTNLDLTGRLEMFEISIEAIKNRPFFGYGINCTIVQDTLTWGNPQNALLKFLLDFGIIGTIAFFIMCLKSYSSKSVSKNRTFSLAVFLLAMAVCAMVEINISGAFYFGIGLFNSLNSNLDLDTYSKNT